jgi:hypothetical protein
MTTFPVTYQRPGHGDLVANNETEARQWAGMGWLPIPNKPAKYELYPILLYGPPDSKLPPLTANTAAEVKAAAVRGYAVPSDDDLADGEEGFDAQFATVDEEYAANEYPKALYHPEHRPAVPQGFDWAGVVVGAGHSPRPIAAVPEAFPPMTVTSLQEEMAARSKGWTIGASSPRRMSGAARRKLARERQLVDTEQKEIAPS